MTETFHLRLTSKLMEEIREIARSLSESPSEFVRRAVEERIERIKGEVRYSQLTREEKVKEIFRMLNMGAPRWKIAEVIGDPNLIDECHQKWISWVKKAQAEDYEKRQLRRENEIYKLILCAIALERYLLHDCAVFVYSIISICCESASPLPSEFLGCSIDNFMEIVLKLIREEEAKTKPINDLLQQLSSRLLEREVNRFLQEFFQESSCPR
ncbi:MAG: ribbon-helix-helix protein, CopG family [Candidatus Bathyarchaeia archaeon]